MSAGRADAVVKKLMCDRCKDFCEVTFETSQRHEILCTVCFERESLQQETQQQQQRQHAYALTSNEARTKEIVPPGLNEEETRAFLRRYDEAIVQFTAMKHRREQEEQRLMYQQKQQLKHQQERYQQQQQQQPGAASDNLKARIKLFKEKRTKNKQETGKSANAKLREKVFGGMIHNHSSGDSSAGNARSRISFNSSSSSSIVSSSSSSSSSARNAEENKPPPRYHNAVAIVDPLHQQQLDEWQRNIRPMIKVPPTKAQEAACHFLWTLRQQGFPGALVGDEMGCGKTFTALLDALCEFLAQEGTLEHVQKIAAAGEPYMRPQATLPVVIVVQNHQAALNWCVEAKKCLDLPDNFTGIVQTSCGANRRNNEHVLETCAFVITYGSALSTHFKLIRPLGDDGDAEEASTEDNSVEEVTEIEGVEKTPAPNGKRKRAEPKHAKRGKKQREEDALDWLDSAEARSKLNFGDGNIYGFEEVLMIVVDEVDYFLVQDFNGRSSLRTTGKLSFTSLIHLLRLGKRSLLLTGTPTLGNAPEGMVRQLLSMMQLHLFMRNHPEHELHSRLTTNGETNSLGLRFVVETVMKLMIRRRKADVNPNITTSHLHDISVPLSEDESREMADLEKMASDKLEEAMTKMDNAINNEEKDEIKAGMQGLYLKLLTMLRMATSSNIELFLRTFHACEALDPSLRDKKRQELTTEFNQEVKELSSKETLILAICQAIADILEKAVIFTEFRFAQDRLHHVLMEYLKATSAEIAVFELRADQSPAERSAVVQLYNEHKGPAFLLVPIKLGGRGLNLQVANHVIMPCSNYNPSNTDQALARMDRIGQLRTDVHVWNLLCGNTIEPWIHDKISIPKTEEALQLAPQDRKNGFLGRRDDTLRFGVKGAVPEENKAIRAFSHDVLQFSVARNAARDQWTMEHALAMVDLTPSQFFEAKESN
jgi:SNF2 family DNA or RNA helicase